VDPQKFVADLADKPAALRRLAGLLADRDRLLADVPGRARAVLPDGARPARRVVLLGMGSSRYAADVEALRLRARGLDVVAEYASARAAAPPGPDTLVVAISASGSSAETLAAARRYAGRSPLLAVTNTAGSALAGLADGEVGMHAGVEAGGVACRSFQHTGLVLRSLLDPDAGGQGLAGLAERVADGCEHLLATAPSWLPELTELIAGPDGSWLLAPVERLASALQSALMLREGPRRPAVGCETGDWSHVDVYLTKTQDYRAVLFADRPGSTSDAAALEWLRDRGSTVIAVGGEVDGAAATVRYPGDDDPDVRLFTETLVVELVAGTLWNRTVGG
jgi:fructoselysine-6-P-deglycase FrlB-like protein